MVLQEEEVVEDMVRLEAEVIVEDTEVHLQEEEEEVMAPLVLLKEVGEEVMEVLRVEEEVEGVMLLEVKEDLRARHSFPSLFKLIIP